LSKGSKQVGRSRAGAWPAEDQFCGGTLNQKELDGAAYALAKGFLLRSGADKGLTPYNVDKLFWLVGSGSFHEDPHLGNKGKIGSRKKGFIEAAKTELEAMIARKW
jgi:hypothetical protein